ncbi:hypothetical protein PYW08_007020 [Mythimna loreyi]|uniref:Uncharacterized protein n=1 Tax=Mythimna loreyi TaxID=667449 RepID=A0ACC2R8I4_9NEOP|nr:hypothetical protein PYW08_007020 [Mythimna loreyi]
MHKITLFVLAAVFAVALAGQYYVPRAYYTIDAEGHESARVPLRRLRRSLRPYPYANIGANANANANAEAYGGGSSSANANAHASSSSRGWSGRSYNGNGGWNVPGGSGWNHGADTPSDVGLSGGYRR